MSTKNLLFVCLFALSLAAQVDQGRIAGTVKDQSNAVFPGASVTVKNVATGEERTVSSNESGDYLVTALRPSTYRVRASATGFAVTETPNVAVGVGQLARVDIVLKPADVSQTVNVVAMEEAALDTTSAHIGVNVTPGEVGGLPMNGRQVSQLYLLAPGAVNYGSGTFDDIRFNGRANEQNAVRFDGIEGSAVIDSSPGNLNGESTSVFRLESSLENVQEFRVESSNYTAEFGTGTGGQISVITKSGSNNWHGSLFEYLRNTSLDARNFFDGKNPSILKLNQFGGSIGGPIVKDKFFFYASYESLRQRSSSPIVEITPSGAARARAVASIRPLLAAFPIGNAGPSANPDVDLINIAAPARVDEDYGGIPFDYNIKTQYRLFPRYFPHQGTANAVQNSTRTVYGTTIVSQ